LTVRGGDDERSKHFEEDVSEPATLPQIF
jgi:hypothetical protein